MSQSRPCLRRVLKVCARLLGAALAALVLLAAWRSALVAPEPTLLLLDRNGEFLGEVGAAEDGELGYWPLETLPRRVVAATLAIEDRRFWTHPGVDPLAIARALRQRVDHGRTVSDASTVAMQVARMQSPGARTYARKALEALTALALTLRNGRESVLRHYLRIVPYGNRIHGIAFAARSYLDKPVEDLSWAETAFLTAIPQAPARMNPFHPEGRLRAIARGGQILGALHVRGAISGQELDVALEQLPRLQVPPRRVRPQAAMHALLRLETLLAEPAARRALHTRPIVRTTLDLELQSDVAAQVLEAVGSWHERGAGNAALVVLDRARLDVLAWVGSTDYFDRLHAGAIDYARVERSPGSTLKPFLYALALERGLIGPSTVVDDLHRASGGISNADDSFLGPVLPRVALANSRNVPAARLLAQLGVDQSYGFLRELGLHDGRLPVRHFGLEMAIGGLPTTLERLALAYGALAGDGRLRELRWYEGQSRPEPVRVLSESSARQVTLWLSDPMARLPSFPRKGWTEYPFPVAVKTGTSTGYRDAWTMAYSTRYLVGVWIGHPDARPMNGLSGYRAAARLTQGVLLHLHRDESDGLQNGSFPPPERAQPLRVCARTGWRATPACDQVLVEWFVPGHEPVDPCTAHVRLAVDTRDGALASVQTPPEFVEIKTFTELEPRYAAWAAAMGLPRPPASDAVTPRRRDAGTSGEPGTPGRRDAGTSPSGSVRIASPEDGERLLRDPEVPPERSTLLLSAVVQPPVPQLVWYVDGEPFAVVEYPYTARWQLVPGDHTFEARIPFTRLRSPSVRISVQ